MSALLGNALLCHDDDTVSILDRRQPVGND
jgi:hypothetical protein